MKQTVEEAAKEYSSQWAWNSQPDMWQSEKDFKAGADWQSKQSPWISVEDAIPNKQAKGMCQVKFVDGSIEEMAMREVNNGHGFQNSSGATGHGGYAARPGSGSRSR